MNADLRECGVQVHYFATLLGDVLQGSRAGSRVLDRVMTEDTMGPTPASWAGAAAVPGA